MATQSNTGMKRTLGLTGVTVNAMALIIHEHGVPAYPEHVLTGQDGTPKSVEEVKVLKPGTIRRVSTATASD
jgi:hypothetical protein